MLANFSLVLDLSYLKCRTSALTYLFSVSDLTRMGLLAACDSYLLVLHNFICRNSVRIVVSELDSKPRILSSIFDVLIEYNKTLSCSYSLTCMLIFREDTEK